MVYPPVPVPQFNPFSCPGCQAPASAQPSVQGCSQCGLAFVLRAGARVDANVRPPQIDPRLKHIKTTSAGWFVRNANIVAPAGVMQGTLDPVTGMIPLDTSGVAFGDLVSVAVWRKLDILRLVLSVLLLLPMMLGLIYLTILGPVAFIGTGPMLFLLGFAFYKILVIRRNFARVVGTMRILTVQFDTPVWRRRAFHDELLRRAGLPPSPIP